MEASGERYDKNGKEHIKLDSFKGGIYSSKARLQFDNPFRNNKKLSIEYDKSHNDKIPGLLREVKPILTNSVSRFIFILINNLFKTYSYDELFPK